MDESRRIAAGPSPESQVEQKILNADRRARLDAMHIRGSPMTAEQERAAVVAFLKRAASSSCHSRYGWRDRMDFLWMALWRPENLFSGCWLGTAIMIEAGEHMAKPEHLPPPPE